MALLDDIIAFYDLGDDAQDDSGNALHGTNDGVTFNGTVGTFDGASDITLTTSLFGGTNCSISLWVTPAAVNSYFGIFSIYTNNSNAFEVFLHAEFGNGDAFAMDFGSLLRTGPGTFAVSTLADIVITYNGTTGKFYVNGVEEDSRAALFSTLTPAAYIGSRAGTFYYNGTMQSLGVWDRTLDTDDVDDLYNGGTPLTWAGMSGGAAGQPAVKRMGGVRYAHRIYAPQHCMAW